MSGASPKAVALRVVELLGSKEFPAGAEDADALFRAYAEPQLRLAQAYLDMHAVVEEFVQRVEKGEVRSRYTYGKFKALL